MNSVKDIVVVVATHKKYPMPEDKMYLPLEVGAFLRKKKTGYIGDDTGENISDRNAGYSELTGLYWAWKNLKNDYIGLVHYRRYFASKGWKFGQPIQRLKKVLTKREASSFLNEVDVVLPKKRNYYVENLYDHYIHTMYEEPLIVTKKIINEKFPEYSFEFARLHKRKEAHMFNMFIMKRDILDGYCEWLFDILFELEKRMEEGGIKYDVFHARFYGRISELLLDVYLNTNGIKYREVPVFSIEPVNWIKKGGAFISAKVFGRKYKKSF